MVNILSYVVSLPVQVSLEQKLAGLDVALSSATSTASALELAASARFDWLVVDAAALDAGGNEIFSKGLSLGIDLFCDGPVLLQWDHDEPLALPDQLDVSYAGRHASADAIGLRARAFVKRKERECIPQAKFQVLLHGTANRRFEELRSALSAADYEVVGFVAAKQMSNRQGVQITLCAEPSASALAVDKIRKQVREMRRTREEYLVAICDNLDEQVMASLLEVGYDECVPASESFDLLLARLKSLSERETRMAMLRAEHESSLVRVLQKTAAERARRALEDHNALLNQLTDSNLELDYARREAESAAAAKSGFLAGMSHEIRTPLNAIIGMSELLRERAQQPEHAQWIDIIRTSGNHLLTLISHILDFSKIEAGKMELVTGEVPTRRCVEEALEIVAFQSSGKSIELGCVIESDVPARFLGDEQRIRQVLVNLLSNGVKYTEEGSVTVRVTAEHYSGQSFGVCFEVRDTGSGIPEKKLDEIFVPFGQVPSISAHRVQGSGLGLAISRSFAEMMNGELTVRSRVGEGSTFSLNLPVVVTTIRDDDTSAKVLLGLSVLVLMRDGVNRQYLERYLGGWGAHVFVAERLSEVDECIAGEAVVDVTIMEQPAEGVSSDEAAASLREIPALSDTSFVLSAPVNSANASEGEFVALLTSPYSLSKLHETMKIVVDRQGSTSSDERAPGAASARAESSPQKRPLNTLIVEDNAVNAQVASLLMHNLGLEPDVARSCAEAIEAVQAKPYDLIFMDVEMPLVDGLETTRMIRGLPLRGPRPIIIALTAAALIGDRERCISAGMDDYIVKPVTKASLKTAIERALQLIEIEDQNDADRDGPGVSRKLEPAIEPGFAHVPGMTSTQLPSPDIADGCDSHLDDLASTVGADAVCELIRGFVEEATLSMQSIAQSRIAQDLDSIRRQAHTLKSSAGYLGCGALRMAAAELEAQARQPSASVSEQQIAGLEQLLMSACGELKAWANRVG